MTKDKANNNTILHTQFLKCFNTPEAAQKINDPIGPYNAYKSMIQRQRWLNTLPGERSLMDVNNGRVDPHR